MSFYYANARQPEILRTVQKDLTYTSQLAQDYSDILKFSSTRLWIKYNRLCPLLAELSYHGFASWNNLQTLGEEYTGIIQIDSQYVALPNKLVQMISIILEFGGVQLLSVILRHLEQTFEQNDALLPHIQAKLVKCCQLLTKFMPYLQTLHRSWFYWNGGKYHISKRVAGINYVLVRYWLKTNYSELGYKILGALSFMQLTLGMAAYMKDELMNQKRALEENHLKWTRRTIGNQEMADTHGVKCVLCLETRRDTSVTDCGHLFCWNCILDWMNQKEECPVCREALKKSSVIYLRNFA